MRGVRVKARANAATTSAPSRCVIDTIASLQKDWGAGMSPGVGRSSYNANRLTVAGATITL